MPKIAQELAPKSPSSKCKIKKGTLSIREQHRGVGVGRVYYSSSWQRGSKEIGELKGALWAKGDRWVLWTRSRKRVQFERVSIKLVTEKFEQLIRCSIILFHVSTIKTTSEFLSGKWTISNTCLKHPQNILKSTTTSKHFLPCCFLSPP